MPLILDAKYDIMLRNHSERKYCLLKKWCRNGVVTTTQTLKTLENSEKIKGDINI